MDARGAGGDIRFDRPATEPLAGNGVHDVMLSRLRRLTPKQYLLIGLGAAAVVGVMLVYRHIDVEAVHRRAEALNGFLVFAAIVVLPLVGFPVTVVHAVAGLHFGLGPGCVWVALATVLHFLAAHGLVKLAPGFFARKLEPLRKRLPNGTHTPVTLFTMLLPGVPYFAQIYVLPLIGVPLGTFLRWGLPITVARSVVGVTFGDIADHLTPLRLAGFAIYFAAITVACSVAFHRLRRRMMAEENAPGRPTPLSEPIGGWERFFARKHEARRLRSSARR
ncbi:MAG: associated Golgi protein [Rariglobus sp.]|jgi:uncharacterized membrane protein YdjX (TVP38/TMEM64 family)|nr:associated Golgi protein [Rariglobus sp.]